MTLAASRPPVDVRAGFIPLIDCAPLIVASALGFAHQEGLALRLHRETSWATLRDRLCVGHLDAAHLLAPMPIAANLGLTPLSGGIAAPIALGTGGNTITVSRELWAELRQLGATCDFDAANAARAMAAHVAERAKRCKASLVLAVVHPFSAHRYQLAYWLAATGLVPDRDVSIIVLPPSLMPAALAGGQIDGFCAGEPWGSYAVADGSGVILTTNAHIWRSSPEKVLGLRAAWGDAEPEARAALVRVLFRAAAWCDEPENRTELASILARPEHLDLPAASLAPTLARGLMNADGEHVPIPGFLTFAEQAATFPWTSHALWFLSQMVRWGEAVLSDASIATARASYRPDIYRAALAPLRIVMPSANAKVEGALPAASPAASPSGRLMLGPDPFFDGGVFDPDRLAEYVRSYPRRPV